MTASSRVLGGPSGDGRTARAVSALALTLAVVAIVVLGLALPGLGLLLAGGLAFTVYREQRGVRNALLALGVAITLLAVVAALGTRAGGAPAIEIGEPVRVESR